MVDMVPIPVYMPKNPQEFTTKPYDVISDEELVELRKKKISMVHIMLPQGENKYENARKILQEYIADSILKFNKPSLYLYSQKRNDFRQRGIIGGFSLMDYGNGRIKRHEKTREKPLKDRIQHIKATKAGCGLVWMMIKSDDRLKQILDELQQREPLFSFEKYGWTNTLWRIPDEYVASIQSIIKEHDLYIADGHHRIASAYEYMKEMHAQNGRGPWDYVLGYVANDDELRILPYNRVIRELRLDFNAFMDKIREHFDVIEGDPIPKKHEICMFNGKWYKLIPKHIPEHPVYSLDVSLLQEKILSPILGITDPRKDPNIFFIGGELTNEDLEDYVTKKGNAIVFSLYPTNVEEVERVADQGLDMPPKSTWFDPKLLSGMVIYPLEQNTHNL